MTTSLAAFLVRRLVAATVLVAIVSTGALVLTHLAPGDATTESLLSGANPEAVAAMRARLGLDRPFTVQLQSWFAGLVRFDLGASSYFGGRPVGELVGQAARHTAQLASLALLVATLLGLPLGVLTGARPHGLLASVIAPISIALVACPPLVGALGLLLLAMTTGWLSVSPGHVAVPALALALPLAATLERVQSQATSDAMAAPDLTATAARGVPPGRLLWVHAGRQALRPVLGIYGIVIGSLFSGSLAVEAVTGWPGLGLLMYDGLRGRDLFLVAGCALLGAICLAAGNLVADVARAVVDPRVRGTA